MHPNADGYKEMYRDKVYAFVNNKYREYKGLYYFALLLGLKTVPSPCLDPVPFHLVALPVICKNAPYLSSLKGVKPILDGLNSPSLKKLVEDNDEKNLMNDADLKKLLANAQAKNTLRELPQMQSIIPAKRQARPIKPIKPWGKDLLKVKSDLQKYMAGAEFKARMEKIKKLPSRPVRSKDLLDELYNKKE